MTTNLSKRILYALIVLLLFKMACFSQGKTESPIQFSSKPVTKFLKGTASVEQYGYKQNELTESKVEAFGRKLTDDNSNFLLINSQNLKKKLIYKSNDWWLAYFEQTYNDVPVEGTRIGLAIGIDGKLVNFWSETYPIIDLATNPSITSSMALNIARSAYGYKSIQNPIWDSIYSQLNIDSNPQLVILPLGNKNGYLYKLAWKVDCLPVPIDTIYYIDAMNGTIIQRLKEGRNFTGGKDSTVTGNPPISSTTQKNTNAINRKVGKLVVTKQVTATKKNSLNSLNSVSQCPDLSVVGEISVNVGDDVDEDITPSGGSGDYSYYYDYGLPTGWSLNDNGDGTGSITGTANSNGNYTAYYSIVDNTAGCQYNTSVYITVSCNDISVSPSTLSNWTEGCSYSQTGIYIIG